MTYANMLFVALSDPTRLRLFEMLSEQPSSVADLARNLPVSQPAVSQHLKSLLQAGLVRVREDGRRRIYSVDPAGLAPLRLWLERHWEQQLAAYVRAVEEDE